MKANNNNSDSSGVLSGAKFDYIFSREEAVEQIQAEMQKAHDDYHQIIALSKPGAKQGMMDLYFRGKQTAYRMALEILTEVRTNPNDTTEDGKVFAEPPVRQLKKPVLPSSGSIKIIFANDEMAGEYPNIPTQPLKASSPAITPHNSPEGQEVIL